LPAGVTTPGIRTRGSQNAASDCAAPRRSRRAPSAAPRCPPVVFATRTPATPWQKRSLVRAVRAWGSSKDVCRAASPERPRHVRSSAMRGAGNKIVRRHAAWSTEQTRYSDAARAGQAAWRWQEVAQAVAPRRPTAGSVTACRPPLRPAACLPTVCVLAHSRVGRQRQRVPSCGCSSTAAAWLTRPFSPSTHRGSRLEVAGSVCRPPALDAVVRSQSR
jgi:hypothetical protein